MFSNFAQDKRNHQVSPEGLRPFSLEDTNSQLDQLASYSA